MVFNEIPEYHKHFSFLVMKTVDMFEWYFNFFKDRLSSKPLILEAGIAFGGSLAAWALLFNARKAVGIDIAEERREVEEKLKKHGPDSIVKTYWNTSQDSKVIKEIINKELEDQWIDIIDGSHIFGPTLEFFQNTFPYLGFVQKFVFPNDIAVQVLYYNQKRTDTHS